MSVPGTLWAKALRSPHHHAGITKLDTSKAESMPGVHAVITWKDVPLLEYGHLSALGIPADEPLLAKDEVRYLGQPIALVAAESEELAAAAVDAIEIGFEERPALFDIREAFDSDAPKIHQWGNWYPHFEGEMDRRQIRKGDIERAFDEADTIVQGVYRPAAIEHAPIETQVCQVVPEPNGRLTIYSCTQALYFSLGVVAAHLQVPLNRLQDRRRDDRRRLRREGRHGDRDDDLPPRPEGEPPGEVALDAGGGVPLLLDAGAVAHGARDRGDEGRLDPRPEDADAARCGRVLAVLPVRPDEAQLPPHRGVLDPEPPLRRVRRLHEPRRRRRRCGGSA